MTISPELLNLKPPLVFTNRNSSSCASHRGVPVPSSRIHALSSSSPSALFFPPFRQRGMFSAHVFIYRQLCVERSSSRVQGRGSEKGKERGDLGAANIQSCLIEGWMMQKQQGGACGFTLLPLGACRRELNAVSGDALTSLERRRFVRSWIIQLSPWGDSLSPPGLP